MSFNNTNINNIKGNLETSLNMDFNNINECIKEIMKKFIKQISLLYLLILHFVIRKIKKKFYNLKKIIKVMMLN